MTRKRSHSMQTSDPGSPHSGEPEFLAVGKLHRPHGVHGEILMSVWTDFPERLVPGVLVYVGEDHKPVRIRSIRSHRDDLLISFEEYPVREEVGLLRNQVLMVKSSDRAPLEDGELYIHHIIGMRVVDDASDKYLGTVTEIIETGANDVYIVRCDSGSELLLPAIDSVILDIDIELHEMRVHILPGL